MTAQRLGLLSDEKGIRDHLAILFGDLNQDYDEENLSSMHR